MSSLSKKKGKSVNEVGRRFKVIRGIQKNNTIEYVVSISEPWMKLITKGKLAYVEFTGVKSSDPVWLT